MINELSEKWLSEIDLSTEENISDSLYEHIRRLRTTEALPAGYVFPNENELCQRLNIARTSIREAYKALEIRGYITRTKRGTRVNTADEIAKALPFSAAIALSDFADLVEYRSVIESQLASLAAQRRTEEDIQALEKHLSNMKKNTRDLSKLTYFDTLFHITVAEATHNELFKRITEMSSSVFASGVFTAFGVDTEENVRQALISHEEILCAIREKNADAAAGAMFRHIANVRERGIKKTDI